MSEFNKLFFYNANPQHVEEGRWIKFGDIESQIIGTSLEEYEKSGFKEELRDATTGELTVDLKERIAKSTDDLDNK